MKMFAAALAMGLNLSLALAAPAEAKVEKTAWGETPGHQKVDLYTLTNGKLTARIATYGGTLVALEVPDRDGKIADVVRGFDSVEGYYNPKFHNNYYGALIGRYANRIKGSQFTLDGKTYHLVTNGQGNTLHGGPLGFDKRVWNAVAHDGPTPSLTLTYLSYDGELNFPGTLKVTVTYTLRADALHIDYGATTDKPTVVNLTNHSYFNLKGAGNGNVLDHVLQIDADSITINDATHTATEEIRPVAGTAFDFRQPTKIGAHIADSDQQLFNSSNAGGYDQNFVIDGKPGTLRRAARIVEPTSGRVLEVFTTQPGVQLFTANTPATVTGKRGEQYVRQGAFCLETQHFPNAPNIPGFLSTTLRPGEKFHEVTEFRFGVVK